MLGTGRPGVCGAPLPARPPPRYPPQYPRPPASSPGLRGPGSWGSSGPAPWGSASRREGRHRRVRGSTQAGTASRGKRVRAMQGWRTQNATGPVMAGTCPRRTSSCAPTLGHPLTPPHPPLPPTHPPEPHAGVPFECHHPLLDARLLALSQESSDINDRGHRPRGQQLWLVDALQPRGRRACRRQAGGTRRGGASTHLTCSLAKRLTWHACT